MSGEALENAVRSRVEPRCGPLGDARSLTQYFMFSNFWQRLSVYYCRSESDRVETCQVQLSHDGHLGSLGL